MVVFKFKKGYPHTEKDVEEKRFSDLGWGVVLSREYDDDEWDLRKAQDEYLDKYGEDVEDYTWVLTDRVPSGRGYAFAVKFKGFENRATIQYVGYELEFLEEVDTIDEAQAFLDFWRKKGYEATATHYGGKHQVYITQKVRKGNKGGGG